LGGHLQPLRVPPLSGGGGAPTADLALGRGVRSDSRKALGRPPAEGVPGVGGRTAQGSQDRNPPGAPGPMKRALAFALLLVFAARARAEVLERIVAVVGEDIVLLSELEEAQDPVPGALEAEHT